MIAVLKRIMKLSGKYRGKLVFSFVMGFMENAMTAVSILFVFLSFDMYLSGGMEQKRIVGMAVMLAVACGLRFLFKLLEYVFQSGVGYEMVCDERLKLGDKLLHLSMGFYANTDAGDISSVINNDLVFVEGMAMSYVSKMLGAIISTGLVTVVLFVLDVRIGVIACLAYPLGFLINRGMQRILIRYSGDRQAAHGETSSVMLEYLQGLYVIKTFRLAGRQRQRLMDVLRRLELVSYDFEMKGMPFMAAYFVVFHLFAMLVLMAVAWFFCGGSLALGTALVLVTMVFAIYAPMELLVVSSAILRLMNACLDRMQSILDCPVMDADCEDIRPSAYDVRFRDVSFSYGQKPVLSGIDFYAPERSLTAIVGPSGSGKSTILSLIARFWDVNGGNISIGGVDVRRMRCDAVMEQISVVFQKAYLFHDTIEANIRFGNADATREEIELAARKAHCHEFIERMEHGYDTVVGEGGGTLSGGERQRITIARALLKDTPIVLLDEVTANIDPENERLIQQAINALVQEKTVFVVAHKLATIRNADQIIVLGDDGTIREMGRHEELMAMAGDYLGLWEKSRRISGWQI